MIESFSPTQQFSDPATRKPRWQFDSNKLSRVLPKLPRSRGSACRLLLAPAGDGAVRRFVRDGVQIEGAMERKDSVAVIRPAEPIRFAAMTGEAHLG
jgi:hypothetical protein